MDPKQISRLIEVASESSAGLAAWQVLKEALPTAIGQGLAYKRFLPERWSMEQPWYHLDLVDLYAKRLFPLVRETFENGGAFDEKFLRRAAALYGELESEGKTTRRSP
jgi:hypothetical protein